MIDALSSSHARRGHMAGMLALLVLALPCGCARRAAPETVEAPRETPASPPAQPSPDLPGLVVPDPDPTLAALPSDVRLPDRAAWQADYRKDCEALAASPCELTGDLDRDGVPEQIVEIRSERTGQAGLAVLWGSGAVSIVGAGTPSRQLRTEVYADGVDLEWSAVEDDLSFVMRWGIAPRKADGFAAPDRASERSFPAPAATGAGVWLDGGDAAEVLYWDGSAWRRLVVGF
jgi:hypothetical protein